MRQVRKPVNAIPHDFSSILNRVYESVPSHRAHMLKGDASSRSYYRVEVPGHNPASVVVMYMAGDPLASDEGSSSSVPKEIPFLNVQRHLLQQGLRVPKVLAVDIEKRMIALEDLGDETLGSALSTQPRDGWAHMYECAVDLLANLHEKCAAHHAECVAYGRSFDEKLLRWELDHFREWGLQALHAIDEKEKATLAMEFDRLARTIAELPTGFVHRDYQSRNLMWLPSEEPPLAMIDFQDALLGPRVYDLVALLCDSYVDLDIEFQLRMIARYAAQRMVANLEGFTREFWLVAVQRKLKDAGRFVFLDRVKHKAGFLEHYPQSLKYVARGLGELNDFANLDAILSRNIDGFPDKIAVPSSASGALR